MTAAQFASQIGPLAGCEEWISEALYIFQSTEHTKHAAGTWRGILLGSRTNSLPLIPGSLLGPPVGLQRAPPTALPFKLGPRHPRLVSMPSLRLSVGHGYSPRKGPPSFTDPPAVRQRAAHTGDTQRTMETRKEGLTESERRVLVFPRDAVHGGPTFRVHRISI